MHNKKKLRQSGLVIAGIFILALLLLLLVKPFSTFTSPGKGLLLTQAEEIDRIRIAGPVGMVELSRLGDQWTLPGGEVVIQRAVDNILFAAGRLQVDAVQADLSDWKGEGLRELSFYSQGKPVLRYEALGRDGRFMILPEGSNQAFSVSLPGYPELDLSQVFSEEENHYLDHVFLDLLPEEIRRIKVGLKGNPAFSFSRDDAGKFHFDGAASEVAGSGALPGEEDMNLEALRMLFTYFRSIRFEEKAGPEHKRSPEKTEDDRWLATISVETTEGEEHSLEVCSLPGETGEEAHMFLALVYYNSSPDALLVKYVYLDVLMRDFPAYFGDNSLRQ